jgi:hypothetical protein
MEKGSRRHILLQLRDVDKPLQAILHLYKGTEVDDVRDGALHNLPCAIPFLNGLPRVWLEASKAETDSASISIDIQDVDLHLLAGTEHIAWMIHASPGELGDMDQTLQPTQVHKGTEGAERGHVPLTDVARGERVEYLLPSLFVLMSGTLRKHEATLLRV